MVPYDQLFENNRRWAEAKQHRNIANAVANTDLNVAAVIDYAVAHLKVKHIVVCGHHNCGGVKAAMQAKDLGILNPWLRAGQVRVRHSCLRVLPLTGKTRRNLSSK